jgi:hypothetical protein
MAAIFRFYQTCGEAPGKDYAQGFGDGSNDWDFKSVDEPGQAVEGQEIRAGDCSMHVYVRGYFAQPTAGPQWTSVRNVKFWCSQLNLSGCGDGATVSASAMDTYAQPTTDDMSGTWGAVPTVAASGLDVTPGTGLTAPGYTKWVALQLKTGAANVSSGPAGMQYFTVSYDEI